MRASLLLLLVVLLTGILLTACENEVSLKPIGFSNPIALKAEANGWQSIDTIISVDPQTFVQDTAIVYNDLSPDTTRKGDIVYQVTEYAPIFSGCETNEDPAICTQEKLRAFVDVNLVYPRWAKVQGLQGTSIATFTIGADGRVRDMGVERSMGDKIDKLVLQLAEQIPIWYPAFHGGKPVAIRYRLPVTFTLPAE